MHCLPVHSFDLERCGPSLDESGPPTTIPTPRPTTAPSAPGGGGPALVVQKGLGSGRQPDRDHPDPTTGVRRMGETVPQFMTRKIPVGITGQFDFVDVRDVGPGDRRR